MVRKTMDAGELAGFCPWSGSRSTGCWLSTHFLRFIHSRTLSLGLLLFTFRVGFLFSIKLFWKHPKKKKRNLPENNTGFMNSYFDICVLH